MRLLVSDKVVAESDALLARVDAKVGADPELKAKCDNLQQEAEESLARVSGDGKDWEFWLSIMDLTSCPHCAEPETCLDRDGGSICKPFGENCRLCAEIGHLRQLAMKRYCKAKEKA